MIRLFAATLALSALLLFAVQPMLGRALLPLLGGAPAVWTTVMLFFQAALLLGYAWAHAAGRWLPWRAQVAAHLLLLAGGALLLPFAAGGARPPDGGGVWPALWLAGWLAAAVGPPVVAISASAPLLQGWVARAGVRDPYPLYAASNAGSLVALLAYPLLIEPLLGLARQARAWALGYGGLVLLVLACALVADRRGPAAAGPAADGDAPPPPAPRTLLRWLALSAVPVCLLLGVTTHLTSDVSAVPLLWVAPLATYLVTFIVAFERPAAAGRPWLSRALAVVASPLVLVLTMDATPALAATVLLDLVALLLGALACHGLLARERPHVAHLTRFYLVLAAGGVLGGVLCALVAPLVLWRNLEYPLAVVAACALRPEADAPPVVDARRARRLDLGWALAVLALALALEALVRALAPGLDGRWRLLLAFAPAAVLAHAASRRPGRHALALLALLAAGLIVDSPHGRALHSERSFFGVLRVTRSPDGDYRWLVHGSTVHGAQAVDPARARVPLVYYHPDGPCGDVVAAWRAGPAPRRAGVVGLGVGSLAAYGEPGEDWTFYEIDPAVERLARDPRFFTFLSDCRAAWRVVPGDARRRLAEAPAGGHGVLFLDAFSGDAIPAHLLTVEALELAMSTVAPGGLMALHVSNRHLALEPVVGRAARRLGLLGMVRLDDVGDVGGADRAGRSSSTWIVLARRDEDLAPLKGRRGWRWQGADDEAPWTDDHQNVLGALSFD